MNYKLLDINMFKKTIKSKKMWKLQIIIMMITGLLTLVIVGKTLDGVEPIPIMLDESVQHLRENIEYHSDLFSVHQESKNCLTLEDGVLHLVLKTHKHKRIKAKKELMYIAIQELNHNKQDQYKFEFNRVISPEIIIQYDPLLIAVVMNWFIMLMFFTLLKGVLTVLKEYVSFKCTQNKQFKYKSSIIVIVIFEYFLFLLYVLILMKLSFIKCPYLYSQTFTKIKKYLINRDIIIKQILGLTLLLPVSHFAIENFYAQKKKLRSLLVVLIVIFITSLQGIFILNNITVVECFMYTIVSQLLLFTFSKVMTGFLIS